LGAFTALAVRGFADATREVSLPSSPVRRKGKQRNTIPGKRLNRMLWHGSPMADGYTRPTRQDLLERIEALASGERLLLP
jgi:hypothetical protein